MLSPWLISALLLGAPIVELTDGHACVSASRLSEELTLLQPDAQVRVKVTTTSRAEDDIELALRVHTSLDREAPSELLLERTLTVVPSDCPSVAPLLARIVSRRLAELPRHQWERRTTPAEPTTSSRQLSVFAEGGASVGLDQPDPRGHLTIGIAGELWEGLMGLMGVSGAVSHPVNVGDGEARLANATLWLGLGWRGTTGPIQWMPHLTIHGGITFGQGEGFDDNQMALMPTVEGSVALTLITSSSLHFTLAGDIPIVRSRLRQAGADADYQEPSVRLRLSVGVTWP
jgi:hypothetical protein